MASKIDLQHQIQTLQQQLFSEKGPKKIELEIEIDRLARAIIETPFEPEESEELLVALRDTRAQLVRHIPVNKIKGTTLYLNSIQNVPPSPICPAYNKMSFPTTSTYHTIGNNIACIRLDPKALEYVPKAVLEKVGPLEGKEIDLLWTAIDGRFYLFGDRQFLNHSSHPWAHRHALPGPEKILAYDKEVKNPDSDISFDVNMGIFPEIGLEKSQHLGAIAFHHISPMNVHVHARGGLKAAKSADMLYSPDNAHFQVTSGSPFSMDWSVMQKDNRIAITKRLIIFDYDHPICSALLHSIRNCNCLGTHLERLTLARTAIEKTFFPLIGAFRNDYPHAMETFHQLPLAFQHGIYREAWVSFDSPQKIHGDFGRASFEKDNSLDLKYHCDHQQRAEAIRRFSARLEQLLVGSQFDLLFQSQSLVKGDNILTMMKCAQLFYQNPKEAMSAFGQLPQHQQEAIHFAFWELNGCQRIHNFSTEQFPLNTEYKHEIKSKVQAILLAASRQPHQFLRPIVENSAPPPNESATHAILTPIEKVDELTLLEKSNEDQDILHKHSDDFQILPGSVQDQQDTIEISMQKQFSERQASEQIMEQVFNPEFQSLDNSKKAALVNDILSNLGDELKNRIYGRVYQNSQDPQKGGKSWGELHVADDLDVLINSVQEVFKI